jgi:hypothetical protein
MSRTQLGSKVLEAYGTRARRPARRCQGFDIHDVAATAATLSQRIRLAQ